MLTSELQFYAGLFKDYTELRIQENREVSVAIKKGDMIVNHRSATAGASARVYKGGVWGFASTPVMQTENIKKVVERATYNAQMLDKNENRGHGPLPAATAKGEFLPDNGKSTSQQEIIEFMQEVDHHIEKTYPQLKSRGVYYGALEMEKHGITSDGGQVHSLVPRSIINVGLTLEKDGQPFDLYDTLGGAGFFADHFSNPEKLYDAIATLYAHLEKKADGVFAKPGIKDVILDSKLAGILAHEAIGHTTEYDMVQGGSVAAEYLNQSVASPLITLVDFAHTAYDKPCPIPVYIDDEGTLAQDAIIIKDGILRGYMHNRESAGLCAVRPTGNARAYQFSDEPLIRMRNTAILSGKDKLADMIASVEDGYYLINPSNGQADSTSEFMFGVVLGYEIKNGQLGRGIKETTISGIAFDMLKTVTMVSDDMTWLCGGMCGKKQMIPVGMGGPALKCRVNIGGR